MATLLRLISMLLTLAYTHGLMVLAPVNECKVKKGEITLTVGYSNACLKMGGIVKDIPLDYLGGYKLFFYDFLKAKYHCIVDMCEVPDDGAVSNAAAWTIRTGSLESCGWPFDHTLAPAFIPMTREGCDELVGGEDTIEFVSDFSSNAVLCDLCMKKMNGTDRKYIDGVVFCEKNRCHQKLADIFPEIKERECLYMGGEVSHGGSCRPFGQCNLDVGFAIHCTPKDFWSVIQTCSNVNSTRDVTCTYEKRVGMEVGETESSSTGGSVSSTITTEVGVELEKMFTAKVTASFTTGFNWQDTKTSSQIWSESTTQTLTVIAPPGEKVTVSQVVGVCDQFEVRTTEFRVTSKPATSSN